MMRPTLLGWLVALLIWVGALLSVSWFLLPYERNGTYIITALGMLGLVIPIIRGIVAQSMKEQQ